METISKEIKEQEKKIEKKGGSFIHVDHVHWLLKDFVNDDRISWIFHEKNTPYLEKGGFALLCLFLVFGPAAQLISNTICFALPAYRSIKALESSTKEDDKRWLTYWVVYATFSIVDYFSGFILSWLPFYWLAKMLFLMWCFFDADYNGSDFMYNNVILPFFKRHEKKIDHHLKNLETMAEKAVKEPEKLIETARAEI